MNMKWERDEKSTESRVNAGFSACLRGGRRAVLIVAFGIILSFYFTTEVKAHTVTFKVVNGNWNDNTNGDRSEDVADGGKLTANQIPLVGLKPDSDFKKGKWDTTPNIATSITEDKTYTYTYAPKVWLTVNIIFRVQNGSWNDGTNTDKTKTLSREVNDDQLLMLETGDIPGVGSNPDIGYKAGAWDTAPRTDMVFEASAESQNHTYTYTYVVDPAATTGQITPPDPEVDTSSDDDSHDNTHEKSSNHKVTTPADEYDYAEVDGKIV